ncbi:MAG: purine-nucleoside phosphorylase [Myxococcota bacterium]
MSETRRDERGGPPVIERLDAAVEAVRGRWGHTPGLGIVAGSGLGAIGTLVEDAVRVPYAEIPHMPEPSVVGHAGELVAGHIEGLPVAVLSGRIHRYEGHPLDDVVFGVRLLGRLGAPAVMLTNAAGGIAPWLVPGSLCRVVDQLNMTGESCLMGPNVDDLGPRFPDMSRVYDAEVGRRIEDAAAEAGVVLHHGVYACMPGPAYETPAEVRMLRVLGASVVGMSTVQEATALRHMGVRVGAISVVSNPAAGVGAELLDHAEVKEVADEAGPRLLAVVRHLARGLAAEPLA